MSDSKTPQKEIHPEQVKREQAGEHIQNLKKGELPSNAELIKGIDKLDAKLKTNEGQLSATGKSVNKDIINLLDTTKLILQEKNHGELIQDAFYHSSQIGSRDDGREKLKQIRSLLSTDLDKQQAKAGAKQNVNNMGTIAKLMITSPQFRKFVNRIIKFMNQMYKLNKPKKNKVGHEHESYKDATGLQRSLPDDRVAHTENISVGDKQAVIVESAPATHHDSHGEPVKPAHIPQAELDRLIDEFVEFVKILHSHPEYSNSIEYIAETASKLQEKASEKKKDPRLSELKPDEQQKYHKEVIQKDAKQLIENWIGEDYSLDKLIENVRTLHNQSKKDPELKELLHDLREFFKKAAKDETYVNDEEKVRHDAKSLIERSNIILFGKYRQEVNHIAKELKYLNDSLQNDRVVNELKSNVNDLKNDLFLGPDGRPLVKPELLGDFQIILASILETIKYIPIPPIRHNDENIELQLENIVVKTTHVTPSNVRVSAQVDKDHGKFDNYFEIELSKIVARLNSVNFYVNKKTGFPKIEERGLADIDLTRYPGITLNIQIAPKAKKVGDNVYSVFEIRNCSCSIKKLKIHLRETKHDTLYKIAGPAINLVAKKKIEKAVVDAIRENFGKLNDAAARRATGAVQKKNEAKEKANEKVDEAHAKAAAKDLEARRAEPVPQVAHDPNSSYAGATVPAPATAPAPAHH